MTPLQKAIRAATKNQYPEASLDSAAEDGFFWQIENASNLPLPERHVQLLDDRKFEMDFVWRPQRIVVEIDGGVWMQGQNGQAGGAHSRPAHILRDMEKSNLVQRAGYRFFRFTPDQIKSFEALEFIKELF